MLSYLSADVICSKKRTVLRERSFEEQIMSKDKYLSIFSPQMEAIVFIILHIFFATHAVLKIRVYSRILPSFSWIIFSHMTCLDQLHARKHIWWIIIVFIPCHRKKEPIRMQEICCIIVSIPPNLPIDQCNLTASHPNFPFGHYIFYGMV